MSKIIFTLILCTVTFRSNAQTIQIESYKPTPKLWLKLMEKNDVISNDDILNENLVDLVECYMTDSIHERKTERHQIVGGGLLRALGVRWVTINYRREKFVGTEKHGIRIPKDVLFTEYDINWDLYAHTPKYMNLIYEGYKAQIARRKGRKGKSKEELNSPPYIEPTLETAGAYRIHPEITPATELRPMLNDQFFPCILPNTLTQHVNFGDESPTIGMYGPFILDCNHHCHPEIHPYEWIWWLDLHPNKIHPKNSRTWLVGFMRDVSNRFKHWSSAPRTGEISVPFVFPIKTKNWNIEIEHLVYSGFNEEASKQLNLPTHATPFNQSETTIAIEGKGMVGNNLKIKLNHTLVTTAISWWISDLNFDKETGLVSGRYNLGGSVMDAYTFRLTTTY